MTFAVWYRCSSKNAKLEKDFETYEEVAVKFLKLSEVEEFLILYYEDEFELKSKLIKLNLRLI